MKTDRICEDYIGDGAYVYLTPYQDVVLYTSNGIEETNRVVLEPPVMRAFERWQVRVKQEVARLKGEDDG